MSRVTATTRYKGPHNRMNYQGKTTGTAIKKRQLTFSDVFLL